MNGIINVYKEKGYTSHDVVAKLRGILHMKKIGHTGTLDPDATGVLPVCVGRATKVCDLLTNKDKTYIANVQLGVTTDTLDMTGKILSKQKTQITKDEFTCVMQQFVGPMEQIPPMFSAIKVNGKRLYELARQGKEVERKPRLVTVHHLALLETNFEKQQFTIEVHCSKGTYIRSLCHDIGQALGCGAAMKNLVRTRVGRFAIEEALTLEQIEQCMQKKEMSQCLLPIDAVFEQYSRCDVEEAGIRFLTNGNLVKPSFCSYSSPKQDEYVRMYGPDGQFYAIYRYEEKDEMYHIVKMFHGSEKGHANNR